MSANAGAATSRQASRLRQWLFLRICISDQPRVSLAAILAAGVLAGLVLGFWPQLDLRLSALFYDAVGHDWPWARDPVLTALRDVNAFVTLAFAAAAGAALLVGMVGGRSFTVISPRVAVFLLAVLAAGPGLIANVLLKPQWARPRPGQVTAFGGPLDFMPWWNPFGGCAGNCSFVSGETASAFCLVAAAVVLPPRYRPFGLAAATAYGLTIGLMRIAAGGHFLTDVLFAGVFTALATWVLHRLFFSRWRARLLLWHRALSRQGLAMLPLDRLSFRSNRNSLSLEPTPAGKSPPRTPL